MSSPLITIIIAVVFVGALVFVSAMLTRRRKIPFDQEKYQVDWLKIERELVQGNKSSYSSVIIKADKLLDKALCELGARGKTVGDRIKSAKDKFTKINSLAYAHRLRNQIAHEHGLKLEYAQSRRALAAFRQALIDLGAI
jgi:hypothetical protein